MNTSHNSRRSVGGAEATVSALVGHGRARASLPPSQQRDGGAWVLMPVAEVAASGQSAPSRSVWRGADDAQLVHATLANDQAAWRELMRRYAVALREAARDASEGMSEADADDVVADFWLSLIENDMRLLRAFDASRGAAFLSWLTIRLSQLVYSRQAQRAEEPATVTLKAATALPDTRARPGMDYENQALLRVEDVARRWGIDRKTVYAMIERGQITSRRCGRLVRIPRKVIESFESQASVEPERHIKCR